MPDTWLSFFIATAVGLVMLYAPGLVASFALKRDVIMGIAAAPAISIFLYCIISILCFRFNIYASWQFLISMPILLAILCAMLSRRRNISSAISISKSGIHILLLAILVGVVVGVFLYIMPLDGPGSFNQDADNTFHLSLIRSFADSGIRSPLNTSLYYDEIKSGNTVSVNSGSLSFYPAAWHLFSSLLVSSLNVSTTLAANATLFIFISLVWPTSALSFLVKLYPDNKGIWRASTIASVVFCALPWALLTFGPLYPNLVGFSLAPFVCALIMQICESVLAGEIRTVIFFSDCVLFLISGMALGFSHPNTVFSVAVVMLPYIVRFTYLLAGKHIGMRWSKYKQSFSVLSAAIVLVLFTTIWLLVRGLPSFSYVLNFNWPSFTSFSQEIINILTLAYRAPVSQLFLGAALLLGALLAVFRIKKVRWLVVAYFAACLICFVAATTDGDLKYILAGYWYTDHYRLAATAVLAGMPLAAAGLSWVFDYIESRLSRLTSQSYGSFILQASVYIAVLLVMIYPSFSIAGKLSITTAAGYIRETLSWLYDSKRDNLFDPDEIEFTQRVSEIVNPNYRIFNCADDGSTFAYALYGLNLCYRRSDASSDSDAGKILREHIDEQGENQEVHQLLEDAGIRYVLILDDGGEVTPERWFYGYYDSSDWEGLNSISPETPGFELLLSEGDMRLYEIE